MSRFVINTFYNLLGLLLPGFVAFASIPFLVHGLGEEPFAILSLVINLLVSFVFLDFGLGIGVTKYTAESLRTDPDGVPVLLWTTLAIVLVFSVACTLIAFAVAPYVLPLLQIPASAVLSTVTIFRITVLAIPFVACGSVFRGYIEANNRFDLSNAVKIPSTSLLFLLPLLGIFLGWNLAEIVIALLASRILAASSFFLIILKIHSGLIDIPPLSLHHAKSVLRFGSWVSISNIITPIITHGEKFIISSMISLTALTYYTTSYELVGRIIVIPFSAAITLLPHLSSLYIGLGASSSKEALEPVYKVLTLMLFPITLIFLMFPNEILTMYLGSDFGANAAFTLQILAVAFFFNAFAYISLVIVQSAGRPDLKAKIDMGIGVMFLLLCFLLIPLVGINGAAFAKLFAISSDSILLAIFTCRILKVNTSDVLNSRTIAIALLSTCEILLSIIFPQVLELRATIYVLFISVFFIAYVKLWGMADIKLIIQSMRRKLSPSI